MQRLTLVAACVLALAAGTSPAAAQSTTGTISGHVVDSQGLALPGVTVNATSPNLQGVRSALAPALEAADRYGAGTGESVLNDDGTRGRQ